MVLLFGTAASLRTFDALRRMNPGFATDGVVTVEINLPFGQPRYATSEQWTRFYDQLVERLRAEPGIVSAATVYPLPMDWQVHFEEFTAGNQPAADGVRPTAARYHVSPGYFEAMGIPAVAGRTFTDRDAADSPLVVVVNRRLAERYWPDRRAIGRTLTLHRSNEPDQTAEIIGVVADSKDFMMHEESRPQIFYSQLQRPFSGRFLVVRGAAGATSPAASIRDHVRALDPALPLGDVRRLSHVVFQSVMPFVAVATILGGLGMTALLLVGIGLYGLTSFSMRQRTREIGLRMALGASGRQVVTLVLRQGLVLVAAGLVVGVVLVSGPAVAAERLLGTGPLLVPWPLVAAALVLAAAGMAAAWLPARRAARIEPAAALRDE
jgi:predicted permease